MPVLSERPGALASELSVTRACSAPVSSGAAQFVPWVTTTMSTDVISISDGYPFAALDGTSPYLFPSCMPTGTRSVTPPMLGRQREAVLCKAVDISIFTVPGVREQELEQISFRQGPGSTC